MSKDIIFTGQTSHLGIINEALEQNTGQETQMLQNTVVKRFEKIKEFIKFDDQRQKVQRQNLDSSVCTKL